MANFGRQSTFRALSLSPCATEFNRIAQGGDEFREKRLSHHVLDSLDVLDDCLAIAFGDFGLDAPCIKPAVARPWIIH